MKIVKKLRIFKIKRDAKRLQSLMEKEFNCSCAPAPFFYYKCPVCGRTGMYHDTEDQRCPGVTPSEGCEGTKLVKISDTPLTGFEGVGIPQYISQLLENED